MQVGIGMGVSAGGARGLIARTYDEFVAHIATLATSGAVGWDRPTAGDMLRVGAFRTTANNAELTGLLIGSSWISKFYANNAGPSSFARAIQHGMPTQAAFDDQRANGRQIFVRIVSAGVGPYSGIDRNGYTSLSDGDNLGTAGSMTELIYWDGTQAQRMQPSLGLGPEPYEFTPPPHKTYADFQTHIRSKATSGFANWTTQTGVSVSKFWTTAGPVGGSMVGSSWNGKMETSVAPCRAVQHAMQNQTLFDQQVAAGFDVYFETADGGFAGTFNSVSRNGYTSSGASGGPFASRIVPLLIRWDDTLKKAFQSNPSIGGAEIEYTWP